MKTSPVQLARGVGFGCLAARCVLLLLGRWNRTLSSTNLSRSKESLDKVVPYKIQSMDTENGFCSSETIACYSAMRGRKLVLFGCLSYYLACVISFYLSGTQTLFSALKADLFLRCFLPSYFISFCNCSP